MTADPRDYPRKPGESVTDWMNRVANIQWQGEAFKAQKRHGFSDDTLVDLYDKQREHFRIKEKAQEEPFDINAFIDGLLANPHLLPGLIGMSGVTISYYLLLNKDVLKEAIRAVGNFPPDTLQAELDIA